MIPLFLFSGTLAGMIRKIWYILFYQPLYNALIFFVQVLPFHSMFLAVIILTIIVRIILYPLSYKAVKTQIGMQLMKGEMKEIQERYKEDKQEQAKKTMELYRKYGVNPFSSFLVMLVQFPLIIALYKVFIDFSKYGIKEDVIYPFITKPEMVNFSSFGVHLAEKSIVLALLVGISQYFYFRVSEKVKEQFQTGEKESVKDDPMQMVGKSMKYTMPIIVTIFSYMLGGALALYWFVSNLFLIAQEWYIGKRMLKSESVKKMREVAQQ